MADEWAVDNATDEEKLRIAQHYLMSSPPGQIHEVLRDVSKLVPSHVLTDAAVRGAYHTYNLRHAVPAAVPDADYQVLICEESEVDPAHYVDPIGRRVLGYDHVKQQIVAGDVSDLPASFQTQFENERSVVVCRSMIEKALQAYTQSEYMSQGAAGVYGKGSQVVAVVCTERINLRNFWSGRWHSRWEVDVAAQPMTIKGKVELHVHYFENGNLQLQNEKQIEAQPIIIHAPNALGDTVVRLIKEAEDDLQSHLEDMYINMSQETFKEMRRVMPVTQNKMQWSLHAHRTAKDLSKK
ncbi:TPA: hypothetical protein N0F65_007514 [Lagenidium giganteum]|uniref:F-actin-capping protein subunit alpha n=1 Tax=Lagenidium giganteum TaxID=4803 RepID=A0AAV2ZMR4_9STRA|nr:TPA: hypothetical protein N0F65_007514 [Lagenidium giganteum]